MSLLLTTSFYSTMKNWRRGFFRRCGQTWFFRRCGQALFQFDLRLHLQGFLFAASYLGKSNYWASCAASSYETIGKVPFPGFLCCIKLLGKSHFGGPFFVTSSWESCICSVFLRNILLGNCWDSVFFCQQSIGEFPSVDCSSAASYWGRALFGHSVVSSCWGISTCRASSASKLVGNSELPSFCAKLFEDFDCELLFCLKLLRGYDSESSYILNTPPSPHLAISVHQVS